MDKVISVEKILVYKEAIKTLKSYNLDFDKKMLLNNPELCREIIRMREYFGYYKNKGEEET